jgi:hypothetical protein
LGGFLRKERKFPTFPELIFQIKTDVQDAKDALDLVPYANLQNDAFIKEACRQLGRYKWVEMTKQVLGVSIHARYITNSS